MMQLVLEASLFLPTAVFPQSPPMCVSFSLMRLLLEKVITTSIPVKILAGWFCQGSVTVCMICMWAVNSFHGSRTRNLPKLVIKSLS
jgi:membrane protein CcdC involved in cytochrome C biogenesis